MVHFIFHRLNRFPPFQIISEFLRIKWHDIISALKCGIQFNSMLHQLFRTAGESSTNPCNQFPVFPGQID